MNKLSIFRVDTFDGGTCILYIIIDVYISIYLGLNLSGMVDRNMIYIFICVHKDIKLL